MSSDRRGQAQSALGAVRARHDAIQNIEKTIIELNQLFQDLDAIVVQQEPAIQATEQNAEQARDDVNKATEHTERAVDKARSARKKKWWCLLIVGMLSIPGKEDYINGCHTKYSIVILLAILGGVLGWAFSPVSTLSLSKLFRFLLHLLTSTRVVPLVATAVTTTTISGLSAFGNIYSSASGRHGNSHHSFSTCWSKLVLAQSFYLGHFIYLWYLARYPARLVRCM